MQLVEAPLSRREKRKQEIRSRIEDGAYTLFKEQGIEDTSVEQICGVADVARRTFYGYFPNKAALLRSLSQSRVFGTADRMVNEIMRDHSSARGRMRAMIDYMEQNLASYDEIDRRLILVQPTSQEEANHLREISFSLQDRYAEFFEQGQLNGDVSEEFSAQIFAEMVAGTLNNIIMNWALDHTYPIKEKLEEARALFTRIICK